jgi:hypothetical protein
LTEHIEGPKVYRLIPVRDYPTGRETFTVEIFDGANVVERAQGFPTKATADAWIADNKWGSPAPDTIPLDTLNASNDE